MRRGPDSRAHLSYAQEVASYWLEKYDWRKCESRLNQFAQFKTTIDVLGIHFIHVRSQHPDGTPLIVTHGRLGSTVEFQKVVEPLTNPTAHGGDAADTFHIVCSSLPGYGFSDRALAKANFSAFVRSLLGIEPDEQVQNERHIHVDL